MFHLKMQERLDPSTKESVKECPLHYHKQLIGKDGTYLECCAKGHICKEKALYRQHNRIGRLKNRNYNLRNENLELKAALRMAQEKLQQQQQFIQQQQHRERQQQFEQQWGTEQQAQPFGQQTRWG